MFLACEWVVQVDQGVWGFDTFVVVVVLLAKTFGNTPVGPSSFSVASFAARGHFVPTAFPFLSPSEWSVAGDTDFALDVPSSVQDGFYDVHAGKLGEQVTQGVGLA